ncbi:hypothetical protein FB451DRAFT_1043154 [Mycena latifolia]|nr:hypothetical protein FB451DRAFT_1043154 [Mycena latifolia]
MPVDPILDIPSELTIEIFLDCLPAHGRIRPSCKSAPLNLSQVCRRWRRLSQ